jgi:hypothetical protein
MADRQKCLPSRPALGPLQRRVWPARYMCQVHPRGDDDFDIWLTLLCHPLKCSNLVPKFLKSNKHKYCGTRLVGKVNTWLFYTFTWHVVTWNRHFMSANTSPKLKLLLVLEESQAWSNARDLRQLKWGPLLKLTKWINVAIPCSPYIPHGAFVEFFTLYWAVERWNLSSISLLLSLFLKSIGENMVTKIIWFLKLRNSGTLFGVCFLTSAQQRFLSILPSKG